MDGWMDRWLDRWMNELINGWMDGAVKACFELKYCRWVTSGNCWHYTRDNLMSVEFNGFLWLCCIFPNWFIVVLKYVFILYLIMTVTCSWRYWESSHRRQSKRSSTAAKKTEFSIQHYTCKLCQWLGLYVSLRCHDSQLLLTGNEYLFSATSACRKSNNR